MQKDKKRKKLLEDLLGQQKSAPPVLQTLSPNKEEFSENQTKKGEEDKKELYPGGFVEADFEKW